MKVIAYSFNGVKAIEHNSNFTNEALAAAGGKKMIVMCEAGGTMRPTVSFAFVSDTMTHHPISVGYCYALLQRNVYTATSFGTHGQQAHV